jgi:predicted CoA-binding protein
VEKMNDMGASTVQPKDVIKKYRFVAVVGASKSPEKEAFTVPQYLQRHGFKIVPVNPTADSIHGEKAFPALGAIPDDVARRVEVVEVFRPSEELAQVAAQVVEMKKKTGRPYVVWAQQGIENEEAKRILGAAGVDYVMDACMRTVHQLYGR